MTNIDNLQLNPPSDHNSLQEDLVDLKMLNLNLSKQNIKTSILLLILLIFLFDIFDP